MEITELEEKIRKIFVFNDVDGIKLSRNDVVDLIFDGNIEKGNLGKIDKILSSMGIKKSFMDRKPYYKNIGFVNDRLVGKVFWKSLDEIVGEPTVGEIITNTYIHEPAEKISVSRLDEFIGNTEWKTPCEENCGAEINEQANNEYKTHIIDLITENIDKKKRFGLFRRRGK